jgi:hypothetical protein
VLAGPNKGTRGNKSVRKSIKVDKVANQLKAIELLESAQQYEQEGNLEEAVRYYEIAQDYLPTPSADLRVISLSSHDPIHQISSSLEVENYEFEINFRFKIPLFTKENEITCRSSPTRNS